MQTATILIMPKIKKQLSISELHETLSYFRLSLEAREIARLVLVENQTNQSAADKLGKTKQYVNEIVNKVYNGYITKVKKMPKGWIKKEIVAPPELMKKIEKMLADALKAHYSSST